MTPNNRIQIARLRHLLYEMECDAGLDELSELERSILAVIDSISCARSGSTVVTEEIRGHVLLSNVAQATFYRALKSLRSKDFIAIAPNARSKSYILKK